MKFFDFTLRDILDAGTVYDELTKLLGRDHEIIRSMEMFLIDEASFNSATSDKPAQVCDSNMDINAANERLNFKSFEHFIKWALHVCANSFPNSFYDGYKNDLAVLGNSFSLWFSKEASIMIRFFGDLGKHDYAVCITCACDEKSLIYNNAIKYGWEIIDPFLVMLIKEEMRNEASRTVAG